MRSGADGVAASIARRSIRVSSASRPRRGGKCPTASATSSPASTCRSSSQPGRVSTPVNSPKQDTLNTTTKNPNEIHEKPTSVVMISAAVHDTTCHASTRATQRPHCTRLAASAAISRSLRAARV